jgi:hypothetical protein
MPERYRYLKVRLQMEQQRFLNFGVEAGLLYAEGKLCATLQVNRSMLLAILAEIKTEFEEYATANGKYIELVPQSEINYSDHEDPETDLMSMLCLPSTEGERGEVSSTPTEQKKRWLHKLGRSLVHTGRSLRTIVIEPRRLVWAILDKERFEGLISRLAGLNSFLISLLDGSQIKKIQVATAASYHEILQLRNDIRSLQGLVQALNQEKMSFSRSNTLTNDSLSQTISEENATEEKERKYLKRLAELKIQCTQIEQLSGNLESSSATIESIKAPLDITFPKAPDNQTKQARRTTATWKGGSVWVEWKDLPLSQGRNRKDSSQIENRIRLLTELLCFEKPEGFRAPPCCGYVKVVTGANEPIFGIVFKRPRTVDPASRLTNLYQLLDIRPKPPLSARVSLCVVLAESIHSFHMVNWLHKGLRSENILFFAPDGERLDLSAPYISGFELSRPNVLKEMTEKPALNPLCDIYRHPHAQSIWPGGRYCKAYDMYSLGIILIEIAHWKRIEDIMGFKNLAEVGPQNLLEIKRRLLGDPVSGASHHTHQPRNTSFLDGVEAKFGEAYREVVEICLRADETEKPIYSRESEGSIAVRLQRKMENSIMEDLRAMEAALGRKQ